MEKNTISTIDCKPYGIPVEQKYKIAIFIIFIFGIISTILSGTWLFLNFRTTIADGKKTDAVLTKQNKDSINPLFTNVLGTKTTVHYPPSSYFPVSLNPLYADNPDIPVSAYAAMDLTSKELLYGKNIDTRLAIASVTKVMTVLIALDNVPLDTEFTVSPSAATIGEASMGLSAGEILTVRELLYGAMLPSGNDAAEVLAEGTGIYYQTAHDMEIDRKTARVWFIDEMNRKAQSIGMFDTYFFNPTGLDEESRQTTTFSSALDLLALGKYAMENLTFSQIVKTESFHIPYKEGKHKEFYLSNILGLTQSYPGIAGIKPGNSDFAGETLLSYDEHNGKRILMVLLGSTHTKDDALAIYRKIFKEN